jgi:HEAT repeat protein
MKKPLVFLLAGMTAALAGCKPASPDLTTKWMPSRDAVVRQMLESPDPDLRRSAIEYLSARKDCREERYLKAYAFLTSDGLATGDPMDIERHAGVRGSAARALGLVGDPRYAQYVINLLSDPNKSVRWDAAVALDALVTPEAVKPLIGSAKSDPAVEVRIAAVKALRHYSQEIVLTALVGCLDDQQFSVRHQASLSLHELTGESAGTDSLRWRAIVAKQIDQLRTPATAPAQPPM